MPIDKTGICPGCGSETYPEAPRCDCGGDYWREPSFSRWPVQPPEVPRLDGLDTEIAY